MNAIRSADTAPISSEPKKSIKKVAQERPICYPTLCSVPPEVITVSYMTIEMASLKIDSPKTIAYKLTFASISLKTAMTETGSVALIRLPNAKASYQVNSGDSAV